jgi:hypothetical protein
MEEMEVIAKIPLGLGVDVMYLYQWRDRII